MPDASLSLLALRGRFLYRVAAELAAQRRENLHRERVVLPGREAGEERARDDVRRHVLLYGLEHCPATLAGVLDVAADAIQVGVLLEGPLGELEEPAPHDAPLVPQAADGAEVVVVAGF